MFTVKYLKEREMREMKGGKKKKALNKDLDGSEVKKQYKR